MQLLTDTQGMKAKFTLAVVGTLAGGFGPCCYDTDVNCTSCNVQPQTASTSVQELRKQRFF